MKSKNSCPVRVFATGCVVLTMLSIPLFWFRFLCETSLVSRMPLDARHVIIRPSRLVPPELEKDPNLVSFSDVSAKINTAEGLLLGIVDYFEARAPGGRLSNTYYYNKNDKEWTYFDERIGLIIHRDTMYDETKQLKKVQLYAGPEGISETADKSLGRFTAPLIDSTRWSWSLRTVYDKKLRRFFAINFYKRTVVKGPQFAKDDPHKPVQIGSLGKNHQDLLSLHWKPPYKKPPIEDANKGDLTDNSQRIEPPQPPYRLPPPPPRPTQQQPIPIVKSHRALNAGGYLLVLDETGRIDLLEIETLEFAGTAGFLPSPQYSSPASAKPTDLLGYHAFALAFTTDNKYRGMFAASVCRKGTSLILAVFDEKGKLVGKDFSKYTKRDYRRHEQIITSSRAALFEAPWASTLTIVKYLTENLHPPLLSIASYFTADSFEARVGHRALFVLPNSFAAMKARDISENIGTRFFGALFLILPSIILAILLTWGVNKDAIAVGLSEKAKLCWLIGTLAFGLTAYITYRLTRPKITLVTCANCGRPRRPDMDRCHRCGSKWRVPELTPPTWRVIDS